MPALTHRELVGARGQAVRLFYDQPPHVDIAPVFEVQDGGYVLPAGDGTWIMTDPDAHQAFAQRRNVELAGNLITLVRMLKRWNRVHSNRLRAFHLEVMTQAAFRSMNGDMAAATTIFFQYAPQHLHVRDPAGHSGDLAGQMTWAQQQTPPRCAPVVRQCAPVLSGFQRSRPDTGMKVSRRTCVLERLLSCNVPHS